MTLYHLAGCCAAANFVLAALTQSLANAAIAIAVVAAMVWSDA